MNPTALPCSLPTFLSPILFAEEQVGGLVSTDGAAREAILHRAHEIWNHEGQPEHRKLDHWLQAESEFQTQAAARAGHHAAMPA